ERADGGQRPPDEPGGEAAEVAAEWRHRRRRLGPALCGVGDRRDEPQHAGREHRESQHGEGEGQPDQPARLRPGRGDLPEEAVALLHNVVITADVVEHAVALISDVEIDRRHPRRRPAPPYSGLRGPLFACYEPQLDVSKADDVAVPELADAGGGRAIHERPSRRPQILQVDGLAVTLQTSVGTAHKRVLEADVTTVAATDEQMVTVQVDVPAALVVRCQYDEVRVASGSRVHDRLRWHHALMCRLPTVIAPGRDRVNATVRLTTHGSAVPKETEGCYVRVTAPTWMAGWQASWSSVPSCSSSFARFFVR